MFELGDFVYSIKDESELFISNILLDEDRGDVLYVLENKFTRLSQDLYSKRNNKKYRIAEKEEQDGLIKKYYK